MAGFYATNALVLALGAHPWTVDLGLTMEAGERYMFLAALSGPVFGVLGSLWQRARSATLGVLVASLLVFEPLAWVAYDAAGHTSTRSMNQDPLVWAAEVGTGLCTCVIVGSLTRRRGRHAL